MGLLLELAKYKIFRLLNRIRPGINMDIKKELTHAEKSAYKSEFSSSPAYNMENPNGGVLPPTFPTTYICISGHPFEKIFGLHLIDRKRRTYL